MKRVFSWIQKHPIRVMALASIMILLMPLALTHHLPFGFSYFGDKTGPVGDTIGGITAPFIGILSGILVYYTFKEQVKANLLLQNQNTEDTIRKNISEYFSKVGQYYDNSFGGSAGTDYKSFYVTIKQLLQNLEQTTTAWQADVSEKIHRQNLESTISIIKDYLKNNDKMINEVEIMSLFMDVHLTYILDILNRYKSAKNINQHRDFIQYLSVQLKEVQFFYVNYIATNIPEEIILMTLQFEDSPAIKNSRLPLIARKLRRIENTLNEQVI